MIELVLDVEQILSGLDGMKNDLTRCVYDLAMLGLDFLGIFEELSLNPCYFVRRRWRG
jgi:hypothetical protein